MVQDNKTELLRHIKEEVLDLKESSLYKERTKNKVFPVIGEGNHSAAIMFVGEAPGRNEAATGRPFCGAAGKILDELLFGAGIDRKSVYITNIVKDRPPMNRDPFPEEIAAYAPFLDRQINIIQPQVIATLGRFSMKYIMEKFGLEESLDSISNIHGKAFSAKAEYGPVKIIPFFHPATALYKGEIKEVLKKDFEILKEFGVLG
ncbi:MAG: uracil-DNA glycosylase [Candidatus Wildermuthbacteria bacterium]|nr:uracil-DNA glycosylase [Candidatus Wildermuthbacteria bacterium]